MFKRNERTNRIENLTVLNFHNTQYKSLALDLSLYLYTSVQAKVRQNHLKDLLQLYLDVFVEFSAKLGHPANLTFEVNHGNFVY